MEPIFRSASRILVHSLYPFLALVVIAGTFLYGPWVTLVLAVGAWKLIGRFA